MAVGGVTVGLVANLLAFVMAQLISEPERANFFSGLRMHDGLLAFLMLGIAFSFLRTVGWLYGLLASTLAFATDWIELRFFSSPAD
jgi:hypothetical protein